MNASLLTRPDRKLKRKNKRQYGKSAKGIFNITIKNKDKHQKTKTNSSLWKAKKKCFFFDFFFSWLYQQW